MPTIIEQKMLRFRKQQQFEAAKPKKKLGHHGTCKKCKANVKFTTNTLGSIRLIFCPNCKYINAKENLTAETAQIQTSTPKPQVVIKGPKGV